MDTLLTDSALQTGITYVTSVALRTASGRVLELATLAARDRVDCTERSALFGTIDAIMSAAQYAGSPCTRSEACAAAFSVPHGAPVAMALDNIGCTLSAGDAETVEEWNTSDRRNGRILRGGY